MNLKLSAIVTVVLVMLFMTSWELYWRSQGRVPTIDDDKHLFAQERGKVNQLTTEDILIVGSSRVMFNIQLDEFEKLSGKRPLQLAMAGSSPLPVFHDIVENTSFAGTIIVGVTPGLFFSTTFPEASPIKWPKSRVDHFHNRTIASRINHWLSLPLQKNFVFVATYDDVLDDNVDLKTLLHNVELNSRLEKPRYPPFFEFGYIDETRNVRMSKETSSDTAAANKIQRAWEFVLTGNTFKPDKNSTTAFFHKDAETFLARGGKLIFVRSPSSGLFKDIETQNLPRKTFFDSLVNTIESSSYHYEDYEELRAIDCCPEWSHLSAEEATKFTNALVKIMIDDKVLTTK